MQTSIPPSALSTYVQKQMEAFFPDGPVDASLLTRLVDQALQRIEVCFTGIAWHGYGLDGVVTFNHRHSDQYAQFLYFLANSATEVDRDIAERAFEVKMPNQFLLVHPVGSVFGRANYGEGFVGYQNCNVGANLTGETPTFGRGVALFAGARVIGQSVIGENTMIATGTTILNADVPANSVAAMINGTVTFKATQRNVFNYAFRGVDL